MVTSAEERGDRENLDVRSHKAKKQSGICRRQKMARFLFEAVKRLLCREMFATSRLDQTRKTQGEAEN